MDLRPTPISIGVLYDFPQGDGGDGFERALRLGLAVTEGRRSRPPIELTSVHARGLPIGSEHEMKVAFAELEAQGVLAIIGPSISDNALIAAPLCDAARVPAINYSGGERTRSEWMMHYQVGSLEEEPPFLAARVVERGFERCAVLFDESPVGKRYAECFDAARARLGLRTTATAGISPLAESLEPEVERLRDSEPDVLVYFGLGVSSRALSLALDALKWTVPVITNSSLMFGYARPDWRDGYAGWEYVDTISEANPERAALAKQDPASAAGPVGCAAYDMGRLLGEGLVRAAHLTREGVREGMRSVKWLPATSGEPGTLMGFGNQDHGALKGHFLVLREWKNGKTVQVQR
jgi:ABC-type branched-subunit amino acid transport system substrate-binding protein